MGTGERLVEGAAGMDTLALLMRSLRQLVDDLVPSIKPVVRFVDLPLEFLLSRQKLWIEIGQ